jgi:hypothetical protein
MRVVLLVAVAFAVACGSEFEVPPLPDARMSLDLGVSIPNPPPDLACFNRACGGCSTWARFDGTPAMVGDPCLWKGTLACMGTSLVCSDASCLPCSGGTALGTVCGGDGHTIVELVYTGTTCAAYDLGSAIGVCNHGAGDACVDRCTKNGNTYNCAASCLSDDGGGTGCQHQASDTCQSLTSC